MHSFNDSVGQAVGVCVFHNTQSEQNILSSCEDWFIPVRDVKSFQETLYRNDLEPLLTGWSDERKEYRVVIVVTTAEIHLDAELLEELSNKHTMRIIRVVVGDKIKETLDKTLSEIVLPNIKQLPRDRSGKQLTVMPVPLSQQSSMCLWHRPHSKYSMFKQFHDKNQITDIVCLLNEKEDSSKFAEYALKAGVTWHWLPLQGASISYLSGKETQILIIQMAQDVVDLIKKDEKHTILVHCSAGCHRTGFFAYTVLRLLGHNPVKARAGLLMMRRETGVDVGEHRLQVCEDMLVSHCKV
jgi:predicted protein tyrosine phosphatase